MHLLAYLFILSFTTIVSALYFDTPPAATTGQSFLVGWHRDTSDPQQIDLWLANDADQTLAPLGNLDSNGQPQGQISVTITRSGTWRIIVPFGPNPTYTQGNKASSASIHVLDAPAATTQSPATQNTPTGTPTTHNQADTSTSSSSVQTTKASTTGSASNTDSSSSQTSSGSSSTTTTTSGSTNTDDQQSSQGSTTTTSSPTSFPSTASHPGTGVLNGPGTGTDSSGSSTTASSSSSDGNNTSPNVSGDTSRGNTTTIVAVVVGVLAGLVLLVTLFVICVRRARARRNRETVIFYRDRMVRDANDIPPRPSEEISNPRLTPSPHMNEVRQSFLSMGGATEYVGHTV